MAAFTEKAIKESFLKLLAERSYSSITVKDIVTDCGINRNTFYYHFQDIPSLMEIVIRERCDEVIRQYPSPESMEDCLEAAKGFADRDRRMILHIYQSMDRTILETYLWKICSYVVKTYLDGVTSGREIAAEDLRIMIRFYSSVCFGVAMEYLETGMREDTRESFHRFCELKQGQIEQEIERMEKKIR